MARSKRQKAKAKAQRQQIRSEAKASGKSVSRADVQSARQSQRSGGGSSSSGGGGGGTPRSQQVGRANQQVSKASDYKFDQFRKKSVNAAEIRNLRQQGHSASDIRSAAEDSGLKMGGAAGRRLDRMDARAEARERAQVVQQQEPVETQVVQEQLEQPQQPPRNEQPTIPAPTTEVTPPNNAFIPPVKTPEIPMPGSPTQSNDMTQQVQQDNDITTTIDGNNNYVNNQQDNSIRQYGGDNRQFTYYSGGFNGRPGLDTPASMATLGGYYDVDDSPAAQAKFTDLHQTLNRDAQKKYASTGHIAQGAKAGAARTATINTNALDKRIYEREMYSRAKADMMGMEMFGDMRNQKAPDWQSPERQKEVEKPDFEKMYDNYTDF